MMMMMMMMMMMITDEQKVANSFKDFFSSKATSLNLPESQN